MFLKPIQFDANEAKSVWQIIIWNLNVHRITPQQLAQYTGYSINLIMRGIKGEAALVTDGFLRNCVAVFGKTSGRIDPHNPLNINDQMTREECIRLLSPPPAMPTGQKNFWEGDSAN
jgi:hypothetical protein